MYSAFTVRKFPPWFLLPCLGGFNGITGCRSQSVASRLEGVKGERGEQPRPPCTHSVTNNPYTLIDAIGFSIYVKPFVHCYYILNLLHVILCLYETHDMNWEVGPMNDIESMMSVVPSIGIPGWQAIGRRSTRRVSTQRCHVSFRGRVWTGLDDTWVARLIRWTCRV